MSDKAAWETFVANEGRKPKRDRKEESLVRSRNLATKTQARRKAIRPVSDKQAVRNAYLAGVKAERISHALLTDGAVSCSRCPASFSSSLALSPRTRASTRITPRSVPEDAATGRATREWINPRSWSFCAGGVTERSRDPRSSGRRRGPRDSPL